MVCVKNCINTWNLQWMSLNRWTKVNQTQNSQWLTGNIYKCAWNTRDTVQRAWISVGNCLVTGKSCSELRTELILVTFII
jgi:hypothetical protein